MLDTIRRWLGATRRERELRALADDLHHECDRWAEQTEADRKAHKAAMDLAEKQVVGLIRERDEARQQRDDLACQMKAVAAERDRVWNQRDEARRLLRAAEAERDEARETIRDVAANLRVLWEALEPDESQDDRTAPPAEEAKP